jgi:hypothetical protein
MENYVLVNQLRFTHGDRMLHAKYKEICNKTINAIHKMYSEILKKTDVSQIAYDEAIFASNATLIPAPYNYSTFSLPNEVSKLLETRKHHANNPSQFFFMVMTVLSHKGMFSLTKEDKEFYTNNFNVLTGSNPILITNNIANENTLAKTARKIYQENIDKLSEEKCEFVANLSFSYEKIIQMI